MPATVAHDSHYCTCLGHLGRRNRNKSNPICVVLPKVAKASTANVANVNYPLHVKDHLHWRHLLAKPSATETHDCTCLGHLGQYKSQGKYIQHYIAGVIMHNIALNIANVNLA